MTDGNIDIDLAMEFVQTFCREELNISFSEFDVAHGRMGDNRHYVDILLGTGDHIPLEGLVKFHQAIKNHHFDWNVSVTRFFNRDEAWVGLNIIFNDVQK